MNDALVLAASAAVVVLMVAVAAALGFRARTQIDEALLRRLAAAEGAELEVCVIGADGRAALARLPEGKLLLARAMGDDVSARVAPAARVRIGVRGRKISAEYGDLGFPPLNLSLKDAPPAWLEALAQG